MFEKVRFVGQRRAENERFEPMIDKFTDSRTVERKHNVNRRSQKMASKNLARKIEHHRFG